jgi:hypothetical protein
MAGAARCRAGQEISCRSQPRGSLGQHVEAEVFPQQGFEVAAFDDLDAAAVAGGEVAAGLAHPGCGDQDALGGVLVFHHAGQRVHGLQPDDLAVPLGLDDAQPADDRVLVDRDPVDALVVIREDLVSWLVSGGVRLLPSDLDGGRPSPSAAGTVRFWPAVPG